MQHVNSKVTKKVTQSSLSPSLVFPDVRVEYPKVVTEALCQLYDETNKAFHQLVEMNREWPEDYRFCFRDGSPVNHIVQIDMCGLPDSLILELSTMKVSEVREILRGRIFEMENSWALYQILSSVYENSGVPSFYGKQTRAMLNSLRKEHGMKIALLAVTQEKYNAMKATEFGKEIHEPLSSNEVFSLSGFDNFFGPDEFKEHLNGAGGRCEYLLYVRASNPVEKLKRPETIVEHPLLSDEKLRKIIKEYSITLNVDNPSWESSDSRYINDTKWYMPSMSMGFPINSFEDLNSEGFLNFLSTKGVDLKNVLTGEISLRAKPIQGTYGCYGHTRGLITDGKFRSNVRKGLQSRGAYLVQLELEPPVVYNVAEDGKKYAYIDRVFCGKIGGVSSFMGGHRELLPYESQEVKSGRLHGNSEAVFAEIL